jgi:hypothetical protein
VLCFSSATFIIGYCGSSRAHWYKADRRWGGRQWPGDNFSSEPRSFITDSIPSVEPRGGSHSRRAGY